MSVILLEKILTGPSYFCYNKVYKNKFSIHVVASFDISRCILTCLCIFVL